MKIIKEILITYSILELISVILYAITYDKSEHFPLWSIPLMPIPLFLIGGLFWVIEQGFDGGGNP